MLLLDRAEGQQGCLNLKVLFDKGREVLPNGVCWNLVRAFPLPSLNFPGTHLHP